LSDTDAARANGNGHGGVPQTGTDEPPQAAIPEPDETALDWPPPALPVTPTSNGVSPSPPVTPPPPAAHSAPPTPSEPPTPAAQGDRTGPPLVGPMLAVLRHPWITLLPVVLLVGGAAAIGLLRMPTYSAEARLNVGRVDVPPYTLQGVIIGNQSLAVSYSRAINAPDVLNAATSAVGISRDTADLRLSATPVPQSTVIRVDATGASKASSIALANAASIGLRNYVIRLNKDAQSSAMLRDFQAAQRDAVAAQQRLARAQRGGNTALIQRRQLDLQTAQLKASTLEGKYKYQSGTTPPANLVQVLAPATTATSDFESRLEELLLIGLVAGVVFGLALALLRANAESLLRLRA
jgi:capsular polysaccharide biosynthesis protein